MPLECQCPPRPSGPWDCTDCPAHGTDATAEVEAQHAAEFAAENAWLRVAEYDPRMDDPREW